MNYHEAKIQLGGRSHVQINHNTFLHGTNDEFKIRYYDTDILTFRKDGSIFIDCKGFRSKTTKDRLNAYLHNSKRIHSKLGIWYWSDGSVFQDKSSIQPNGSITRPYNKTK